MIKKYIILRPDGNGGVTVFTNEHGFGICFNDEETAKNHLYELGYTDESYAEEGIVIDTIDVSGVPEFLIQFVYDALINNEPDLSACYYIDDTSYRIATTADRDGWNCELLCYNTIDNDDVVLENIVVDKRSPQKIPEAIKCLYNEYVERMEKDEDESESEEEEDDEPDCQICGCQTDLYLIKDFNGKGFDARLCGRCLLKEALRKGKILISNAHFEKDGEMLSAFDYLKTVLDIKPLKKHNNLHQIFAEDKANHPMPPSYAKASYDEIDEESKAFVPRTTNPVESAYNLLLEVRETGDETLVDDAIGYLGQALDESDDEDENIITLEMIKMGLKQGLIIPKVEGDGLKCYIGEYFFFFGGSEFEGIEELSEIPEDVLPMEIKTVLDAFNETQNHDFETEYMYYYYYLLENLKEESDAE